MSGSAFVETQECGMAGKRQGCAAQHCQRWVLWQTAVLAVSAARGVLRSSEATCVPWAMSPTGTLCWELQPGDAEPRSTVPGGAQTAAEEPTVSSGNKTMNQGDFAQEKTFCVSEQILFPQNHSWQRLSILPALPQSAAN